MPRPGIFARAFPIVLALSASTRADLTLRIRETNGASISTRTDYYKPPFWRTGLPGGSYMVADSANRRSFTVDTAGRQYIVNNVEDVRQQPPSPDQTIVADIETKDTGEQRPMFGHTARHIITTQRRHTEYRNQPPGEIQEIVTDGWYLDLPGRFSNRSRAGAIAYLTVSRAGDPVPSIAFHVNGHAPQGLPVWEKSGDRLLEITELSEAPLDPKLFEPPPGFRRVYHWLPGESLSWPNQLHWYWQQFLDWLGGTA